MGDQEDVWQRVMQEAAAEGWLEDARPTVAAVSGGPDSMALLHMLVRMTQVRPFRLIAAHVNHRFRGAESDAEAELVTQTAQQWGVPVVSAEIDVPHFIEETGMNAQAAARLKRYEFLMQTAESEQAERIMFGHHADDQAETVLMRVLRGTGIGGLSGIPYRRRENKVELIRPFLRITKEELLAYCKSHDIPFATDSSNWNRQYFRNAVRLDLIPMLEKYNPRLKESLHRLAEMAAADDDYMNAEAARLLDDVTTRSGAGFRLHRRRFLRLHVALQRRLIKLILRCCANRWNSLVFRQIEAILQALKDGQGTVMRFDIGGGWTFMREYDDVYIGPYAQEPSAYSCRITGFPCTIVLGQSGRTLHMQRIQGDLAKPADRWEALFDEDALKLPLTIRTRQPADRMEPLGLNGTKKVQDMFVDAKIPRSQRDSWPLLVDAEGSIIWIPGVHRARAALVHDHTRRIVHAVIQQVEDTAASDAEPY